MKISAAFEVWANTQGLGLKRVIDGSYENATTYRVWNVWIHAHDNNKSSAEIKQAALSALTESASWAGLSD